MLQIIIIGSETPVNTAYNAAETSLAPSLSPFVSLSSDNLPVKLKNKDRVSCRLSLRGYK